MLTGTRTQRTQQAKLSYTRNTQFLLNTHTRTHPVSKLPYNFTTGGNIGMSGKPLVNDFFRFRLEPLFFLAFLGWMIDFIN